MTPPARPQAPGSSLAPPACGTSSRGLQLKSRFPKAPHQGTLTAHSLRKLRLSTWGQTHAVRLLSIHASLLLLCLRSPSVGAPRVAVYLFDWQQSELSFRSVIHVPATATVSLLLEEPPPATRLSSRLRRPCSPLQSALLPTAVGDRVRRGRLDPGGTTDCRGCVGLPLPAVALPCPGPPVGLPRTPRSQEWPGLGQRPLFRIFNFTLIMYLALIKVLVLSESCCHL